MARIRLLAVVLSLFAVAISNPIDSQVALQSPDVPRTADSWGYDNCGNETYAIQVESLEVSPDPPQPGRDLTVTVKALVTERIEEGAYADVTVKLGLVKLLQKRFDVCEEARNANASVKCPVEVGPYTVSQTVALPKEIPRAKFAVAVRGFTNHDDDMLCLDLHVDFMKRPWLELGW